MVRQVSADKRRLAEEDVKTVKEDYLTIANLAGDLIVRIDKDGRFAFLNDAAIEFWGKPRKKLIGTNFVDYLYPEDKKKAVSTLQEMIKSKTLVKGFILRLKNPMGLRTVAWNVVPIFDESGDYVGTQATGKDLTEILRTEEELAQSKKHVQTLFNVIVDPMLIIELNGNILEFSKSAEETTGFKREEIVGKHFLETTIGTLKTNAIMTRNLQKIKKGMHIPVHTVELVTKDGRKLVCDLNLTKIMYMGESAILAIFHDITGEKKAEETLRQEREVLETITGNMNAGLVIVSKDYRVLWANKILTKHLGNIEGEVCYSILNQRTNICPSCGVKEIFETGKDWVVHEQVVPVPDGQKVWLEISASAIRDENGNIVAASEMSRDITERKRAEKKLRESEEKYRETIVNANVGIIGYNPEGEVKVLNPKMEQMTGFKRSEIPTLRDWFKKLYPNEEERYKIRDKWFKRMSEEGEVKEGHAIITTKDGKRRNFLFNAVRLESGDSIAFADDITEQKKAEEKLQASEERFKYFLENAPEAIWVQDVNGTFIDGNKRAEELTGYKREELIGRNMLEILVPPESVPRLMEAFKPNKLGEISGPNELELIKKDGSLVSVEASTIPIEREGKINIIGITRDITERKKTEELLREAGEKFETYFNLAKVMMVAIDVKGNVTQINKEGCEVLGYKKKQILGKNWFNNFLPKRLEKKTKAYFRKLLSEQIEPLEYYENPVLTKAGKERLIAWHNLLLRDEQGNIKSTLSSGQDITEQKKAEEALRESEANYREIINGMNDTSWVIGLDGIFIDVNDAAVNALGYSREELLSMGPKDLSIDVPEEKVKELIDTMPTDGIQVFETTHFTKDRKKIPVEISSSLVTYQGKQAILSIARDITERKKAEEALRVSEEEAKRLLEFQNKVIDTANAWVNLLDLKGNVILWNRAAELVSGYSREEVIGHKKMWKWLYPDPNYRAKLFAIGKEISEKGKRLEDFDSIIKCKDGSLKTISWYATNVLDEKGKPAGSISVGIDVTERKKAQKAINKAMRLLKQSNEELESYTYVVSHDLKAPLRTIRSFGSFILEDYGDRLDETGQDYLNRIINASSRMDTMIEDLLILSRVGRKFTEIEKVDLNKLLEEILADLEASIRERNAEVVVDKLPVLPVQRVWMRQLFMNLINNALKFNESKTPKIEVLHQEKESAHLFKIWDNGIGIEEKYLKRIFNLFERAPTEKKYEGTGAGLAICKKIVEQLEGKIWVESTPGKGSIFIFTIPKEIKKGEEE